MFPFMQPKMDPIVLTAAVSATAALLRGLVRSSSSSSSSSSWDMTWQEAAATKKKYYVRDVPGREEVADRLAALETSLKTLLDTVDAQFPGDPRIRAIRSRWSGTLSEIARPGDIAYSVNKRTVHMCVRDPETGRMEPWNSTMYVLLHEAAHLATDTWGHPPEYWANFRWLLEVAEHLGAYDYEDFRTKMVLHCGRKLGSNVLECVRDKSCPSSLKKTQEQT
jgi:hypothetical protein